MPRIAIIGTGTNVGKTFITAALTRELALTGTALALKPIETGTQASWPGHPHCAQSRRTGDARALEDASSLTTDEQHPLYGFPEPISPHLAARHHGVVISIEQISNWLERIEAPLLASSAQSPCLLIETAGGAFSPLAPALTNADLLRAIRPDLVLLVAPDALGVLHDVRATITALKHLGHEPPPVCLSAARPPDSSTGSNANELRELGIAKVVAEVGRSVFDAIPALAAWVIRSLSARPT